MTDTTDTVPNFEPTDAISWDLARTYTHFHIIAPVPADLMITVLVLEWIRL